MKSFKSLEPELERAESKGTSSVLARKKAEEALKQEIKLDPNFAEAMRKRIFGL